MQVRTSGRTLLRGSIKNEYNGRFWSDSTQNRRYLYVNPRFYALRRNLFDQNRRRTACAPNYRTANPSPCSCALTQPARSISHNAFPRFQATKLCRIFPRPARFSARAAWLSATSIRFPANA